MDGAAIYRRARGRVTDLVASLDAGQLAMPVPACPKWTVHDVVAHLTGVVADMQAGRTEGAPGDAWTNAQVEARRDRSVDEMLLEWTDSAPAFEVLVSAVPALRPVAMDALTHEWDIRGAVGRPGDKADDDIDAVVQVVMGGLGERLEGAGVGPLRVVAGVDEWLLGAGTGEPSATLTAEPYELFRASFGRRSEAQLRAFSWEGDHGPFLPLLTIFPPSATSLSE